MEYLGEGGGGVEYLGEGVGGGWREGLEYLGEGVRVPWKRGVGVPGKGVLIEFICGSMKYRTTVIKKKKNETRESR